MSTASSALTGPALEAEHRAVRESAGLLDRSERGKLLLQGAEAAEFLQGQVTNDVIGLSPGAGCYALLLTPKGKVRADLRVLRGADWLRLDTEARGLAVLARTVRTYSIGRDVRSTDETAARAILSLVGPAAADALEARPPTHEHAFIEGEHGFYVTTDLGVDVLCATSEVASVKRALGVEEVSEAAVECLRVESGRPRDGIDLDEDTIPQEAGLNERAVSFEKGCYVGQETVARLHYKGRPNRRLRGLVLTTAIAGGEEILLGDRRVGSVGSACVSPVHGPIALALLRREAGDGETVRVGEAGASGRVVELPFPPSSPA